MRALYTARTAGDRSPRTGGLSAIALGLLAFSQIAFAAGSSTKSGARSGLSQL